MTSVLPLVQYEKRVYPFPDDPVERAGNILAAYNASPKALTQLLITRTPVTRLELSKRFEAVVADTALEEADSYNVNTYCHHSLCPLGLVVHEQMPASGRYPYVITYAQTAAGIRYGQPSAAAFLEFERKVGFSLFPILGATVKVSLDDPKPPLTRALILCELMKGERRSIDLALGLSRSETVIKRTLPLLARAGVITYETLNTRSTETQVTFSVANKAVGFSVVPVRGYSRLTPMVAKICMDLTNRHMVITNSVVAKMVNEKHKKSPKSETMSQMVSEVLSGLVEQGYLTRGYFSRDVKSRAMITSEGRVVVKQLIKPLMDAMQDGPALGRWQQRLLPMVQNRLTEYAEQCGAFYYPVSKSQDKLKRSDRLSRLEKLLKTGRGRSVNQLATFLGVSKQTVSLYLRYLATVLPLSKITQRTVVYYSLPESKEMVLSGGYV